MLNDLRLALRSLAKSPAFTVVAVATLALCIGANSAIFTVINSVLLRPLSYPEAEQLVQVYNSYPKSDLENAGISIPDYFDRMDRAPSIEDGVLYTWESYNLAGEQQPLRVLGQRVTASMFSTLRSQPVLGRAFTANEAQAGQDQVVVLSHGLWQEHFGGRADAIGQSLRLNGIAHEVIGVMDQTFTFSAPPVKLWVPFTISPAQRGFNERGNEYSQMVARLKPGTTADQLTAECEAIVQQNLLQAEQFRPYVEATGFTGIAKPLLEQTVGDVSSMLWLLQAGVVAALLIGCANIANLLMTRALARQRELVIRSALGASRWSLVRQLLTESLVLFLLGGGIGLVVAMWMGSGFASLGIDDLPRAATVSLDLPVFAFTFACAGVTGVVFGLLPALQASRTDAADALKSSGTRTTVSRRQRVLRNALVVAEIALSLMLLATTILLTRSFLHLREQSAGFDPEAVMTGRLTLPEQAYESDAARVAFADQLIANLRALPSITSAAITSNLPFGPGNSQGTYHIEGREEVVGQPPPHGQLRSISSDFFATMGVPLQQGRAFTALDGPEAEPVVIIDRVLADRYWPGESPIGKRIYRGNNQPGNMRTIVGVVAAVKHHGLDDPVRKETIYYPFQQRPVTGINFAVRSVLPPASLTEQIRQAVLAVDPDLPVYDLQSLAGRVEGSLKSHRTPMLLLGVFSAMALLLAALGVYGVLAFSVGQRTQEIGIRMALGAATRDVLQLVLRQGLRLVLIGLLTGAAAFVAVGHLLRSLVFEISPIDPASLIGAAVVLGGIGLLACAIPARRAARVDPMVALRDE